MSFWWIEWIDLIDSDKKKVHRVRSQKLLLTCRNKEVSNGSTNRPGFTVPQGPGVDGSSTLDMYLTGHVCLVRLVVPTLPSFSPGFGLVGDCSVSFGP